VSSVRETLYKNIIFNEDTDRFNYFNFPMGKAINLIGKLSIDRWIGAEGVMAVTAYPEKNLQLLVTALKQRPKFGDQDLYASICGFKYVPTAKHGFTSLPGPIGFFYYSGSECFVFFGLLFLSLVLLLFDSAVRGLFKNLFVSGITAFYFANLAAQAGIAPILLIKPLALMAICLTFIWTVFKFLSTPIRPAQRATS
jgi:hypothetical protein